MIFNSIGGRNLENRDYPFLYGNFGIAVAGLVLEAIYNEDFTSLINRYLKHDLGLHNTRVMDGTGNLSFYTIVDKSNPFIPAGGLVSTITDMMTFAQMQIGEWPPYVTLSHSVLAKGDLQWYLPNPEFGVRIDNVGLCWFIDSENNIIWHSGEMFNFNAYIGIDKTNRIAVVVLSNMRPNLRNSFISASLIGAATLRELLNK
jgi:CubicO group peptidase (beta-lactamase class C family)